MISSADQHSAQSQRSATTIIVIPTYNEADNIAVVTSRLRDAAPLVDILIVDDNSPDGTGEIAEQLASVDSAISVMHRASKEGLGAAYIAGFREALRRNYEFIGEMDADGSHQPEQLHRLLGAIGDADLVIGARYVPGGSVINWSRHRKWLSVGGNRYIRLLLGTSLTDATSGYRLFRSHALESIDLNTVHSRGYVFQADMAFRCLQLGLRVVEVPIDFVERERGVSKMTPDVALDSLRRITRWGLRERRKQMLARLVQKRDPGTRAPG